MIFSFEPMKLSGAFASNWRGILLAGFFTLSFPAAGFCSPTRAEVKEALKKAGTYYAKNVVKYGGYVYFYDIDFSRRLGEGLAANTEIWVQPPGTPTVGMAFLDAYDATKDSYYLDAALAAGRALCYGQLESGGWRNSIDFDPGGPRVDKYRNGKGEGKNYSTLDDGITQSALRFLIRLDETLGFENGEIHEAVEYGLSRLLDAQFANGAFPQVWQKKVKPVRELSARYPDYDWRTEGRIKEYWEEFTLNDGVAGSVTDLLIAAHRTYGEERYDESLRNLGNFLILAQMPEPQPAWAQQYNQKMQPIWARAFEPPAVSGRESEDVMIALLKIAEHTGEERFLKPIVPAVKYLQDSLLPDGRQARYYELETNEPLYMERRGKVYTLTNDDSNLPDHYGWKNEPRLNLIKNAYRAAISGESVYPVLEPSTAGPGEVAAVLQSLDEKGRWVSTYAGENLLGQAKFQPGDQYLSSEVFANNVAVLSRFLAGQ